MRTNEHRTETARYTLAMHRIAVGGDDDTEENLIDLLTDLYHLAAAEGIDTERWIETAAMHFLAETEEIEEITPETVAFVQADAILPGQIQDDEGKFWEAYRKRAEIEHGNLDHALTLLPIFLRTVEWTLEDLEYTKQEIKAHMKTIQARTKNLPEDTFVDI